MDKDLSSGAADNGPKELLDMKALNEQRKMEDDVAGRIAIEETRAQLAAAKLNMEKETQRVEQKKLEEEEAKKEKENSQIAGSKAVVNANGGKWVPPHLRGATGSSVNDGASQSSKRFGSVPSASRKTNDLDDNEAFPDLGVAVLVAPEKQKIPKAPKTSKNQTIEKCKNSHNSDLSDVKPIVEEKIDLEKMDSSPPAPASSIVSKPILKKKKKKDLSSFKSS